jgi:putative pyruvate formate lyase activating enzyme
VATNTRGFEPAYLALLASGELGPRVNRRRTIEGAACRTGARAVVNSFGPHHGEEDPLRGRNGSGTIFFSWCNLRCVFCQNRRSWRA